MKSLPAIGFLLLLLYHLIGLPLVVLTFEQSYESATQVSAKDVWKVVKMPISLPYTSTWQNPDGQDGLVQDGDDFYNIVHQEYANDTLYTLLKTNQSAKERFVELAEQWQQDVHEQGSAAKEPLGRLLKLLKDRLKTYLPPFTYQLAQPGTVSRLACVTYANRLVGCYGADLANTTPPPEK